MNLPSDKKLTTTATVFSEIVSKNITTDELVVQGQLLNPHIH